MPGVSDAPISIRITANPADLDKALASAIRRCEAFANKNESTLGGATTNGIRRLGQNAEQSMKGTTLAATNLSYQLNDIGVSLAGGQSPFMIMVQQGAQVTQIFGQMRESGVGMGAALRGAFGSILTPMNLLIFALIGGTGYAVEFFAEMAKGANRSAEDMEKTRKAVESIVGEMKTLPTSVKDPLERWFQTEALKGKIEETKALIGDLGRELSESLAGSDLRHAFRGMLNQLNADADRVEFTNITQGLEKVRKTAEEGGDTFTAMRDYMRDLQRLQKKYAGDADMTKAIESAYGAITKLLPKLQDYHTRSQALADMQKILADEMGRLENQLPGATLPELGTLRPLTAEGGIFDPTETQLKQIEEQTKANEAAQKTYNSALEDMRGIGVPAAGELAQLFQKYLTAIANATTAQERFNATLRATQQLSSLMNQGLQGTMGALQGAFTGVYDSLSKVGDKTKELIRQKEDFRAKAYWDVDHWRVGYGSDTFVDEMGKTHETLQSTIVTVAQAEADLENRIRGFQSKIMQSIGPSVWQSLNENQQAALTSVTYNYGHLPDTIAAAIRTGDTGQVSRALSALASDNSGVNAALRRDEAALYSSGSMGDPLAVNKMTDALKMSNEELRKEMEIKGQLSAGINTVVAARERDLEITRLTTEALRKANEEGRESLTAEETAAIKAQAIERGNLLGAMAAFEAKQKLAIQNTEDQTKALEDQKQASQALMDQYQSMASGAISGFIIDMKNGVSAGEAFQNMINNVIDQLIRMAVEMMIVKPLFDALKGGGGFNLATASPGLFKGGGTLGFTGNPQSRVSPAVFAGARSMAGGGMIGDPNVIPILGHRGEVVIPTRALRQAATSTRKGGGDHINVGPTSIKIDVANGSGTNATSASSAAFGQMVDRAVQGIIVRESRPGGLLRQGQGAR